MSLARQVAGPLAGLALLAGAAPAAAQNELLNDFQTDGQIDACAYSPGQLQNGLNGVPPDVQQYAPGFADQLRAGLETQCGGGGAPAATETPSELAPAPTSTGGGGGGGRATRVPDPPAPKLGPASPLGSVSATPLPAGPSGSDVPGWLTPLLAAAAALALLVLVGLRWSRSGLEPFTRPLRASFGDARGRTADAVAEAWDFMRLGR
jgi:hypothetical protein